MPVQAFLKSLYGKRVFFDPLYGNHGDRLLTMAASALLEQAGITLVDSPESAEMILLNGGGSMVDGWFGLERLAGYCKRYPLVPLAVMPSSFHLTRSDLRDVTGQRQAPLWLWAREQTSLDILKRAGLGENITLGIDHDLAFALEQHPVVRQLRLTAVENRLLIVERDDWEGPTGRRRPLSPSGLEFIPENIRTAIRKTLLGPLRKKQDQASPFRQAAIRFVHRDFAGPVPLTPISADISLAESNSFDEFLQQIARARIIVTTRLHVAILGHLLERKTFLVEGSYHKFRGVFDYSMIMGSSRLLVWNGRQLELVKA